jgi:hypothetical protein
MATPTNSSGKLRVAAGSGNQTFNAGFTFTAGRQAVLVISGYASAAISGITIGGTTATKRADANQADDAQVWDVLGGMTGGTANIVVSFPPGTTDVYLTLAVDEYAASTLSYDASTGNSSTASATTAPTVSTGAAVSTTSSMLYAVVNPWGIQSPCVATGPTSWTTLFDEQDGSTYEMGKGSRFEVSTTGVKTATWSLDVSNNTSAAIAAYIIGGASPDVTVNLTGQSITASAGTVTPARSLGLVGAAVSTALGSVGNSHNCALTGQAMTAAQGTILAPGNVNVTLTGLAMTAAAGTFAPARSLLLVGLAVAAALGVTSSTRYPITVVGTPDPTAANRITATPDIASGDWIQAAGDATGTTPIPTGLVILSDATWEFTSGNYPANFWVRISDDGGVTWGAWALQSIGVTAGLTGQAAAAAAGSVGNSHALAPTGQAMTAAQGAFTPVHAVTLSGQVVTVSAGAITAAIAKALLGQAATFAQGFITTGADVAVQLTGQSMTATAGALTYRAALTLLGSAFSAAQGFITTGNDIVVNLTGQQISAAAGSMAPSLVRALTGEAVAATIGTLVAAHAAALGGQSIGLSQGTLALVHACALLGVPCTVSQGNVVATGGTGVTVNLTGLVIAATQGTVAPAVSVALSGALLQILQGEVVAIPQQVPAEFPLPTPSILGTFASNNPRAAMVAGAGEFRAGPWNTYLGRFAWADDNGLVGNQRISTERLGFALIQPNYWGSLYWSNGNPVLRAGLPITLLSAGDVWARFESGAEPGAQVYARRMDGAAVAGYAAACDLTPWYVVTGAPAGGLAIISTWSKSPT